MYPYLYVFGYPVPNYWLMTVVGVLFCVLYAFVTNRGGKAGHIPAEDVLHILLLAVVGAIVGAKVVGTITTLPFVLPDVIRNWDVAWQNPAYTLSRLAGGLVFYGGAIGGVLMVWWYCRRYAISVKTVFGMLTPVIPLFHVFGRIGCFLAGCCFGVEVPWGIAYPNPISNAPAGVPLLPVQLIEAGCNLVLFIVLAVLSRRLRRKWLVMPLYVACYGVLRFVLEFFRGDAVRGVAVLSTSQWISLALVAAVAVLWFARWRKQPPEADEPLTAPPPAAQQPPCPVD